MPSGNKPLPEPLLTCYQYGFVAITWGHTQNYDINMMTSSNGNIFRVTGPLCGNSQVTGEFPSPRPVTQSFEYFLNISLICALNKRLSEQSRGWRFETPSHTLWRHCNENRKRQESILQEFLKVSFCKMKNTFFTMWLVANYYFLYRLYQNSTR